MRRYSIVGACAAFIAVILGAFAAHGLKAMVGPESIASFQTGVQYQMYHSFALLILTPLLAHLPVSLARWAGRFFVAGIVLFSGSIYLLTLTELSILGPVTPLGGLCFMIGWICLIIGLIRGQHHG